MQRGDAHPIVQEVVEEDEVTAEEAEAVGAEAAEVAGVVVDLERGLGVAFELLKRSGFSLRCYRFDERSR